LLLGLQINEVAASATYCHL